MSRSGEPDGEWAYIPVRRLKLFIEESVAGALAWTVFEPNGLPLWDAVVEKVNEYLQTLFDRGAFAGERPSEAYFVKCDASTTTAADIADGIARLDLGVALLYPSEFMLLSIELRTAPA